MGYVVKDSGTFTPAPTGLHRAVCVDIVNVGIIESKFGAKKKVRLVWEIEEVMEDGRRFIVSRLYTPSLHEKATLRRDLESWRGRSFTGEELKGFDLDNILHVPCQIQIVHTDRGGRIRDDVAAIVPPSKGQEKLLPSGDYVRVQDREETPEREPGSDDDVFEDSVPF